MVMKLLVDGVRYVVSGLMATSPDDRPDNCSDWEDDFGSGNAYPEIVDLRHLMTPVENQKETQSCTANAVAGAYEYLCNRKAMETGDEAGDISRLFIYYVARKYDQQQRGSAHMAVKDSGSSISGAISALGYKGACLEETHPYNIAYVNHAPSAGAYDEALYFKISKSWKIPTGVVQFKHALSLGYPIIFGCKLTDSFMKQKGKGIIRTPGRSEEKARTHGLHAMLIVGYYDSHEVFVVRNSWGEDWGHDGYCFMPYSYIADPELNMGQNFVIQGLSDYDFTPDDTGCTALPDFDEDGETEENAETEILEEESDEDGDGDEEDEHFDADGFFDHLVEAKKVFDKFDVDGSGTMDMEEIANALMMNGHYITDDVLEAIKDNYEGKESVGFDEFLEILGIQSPNEEDDCEEQGDEEDEEVGCDEEEEYDEEQEEECNDEQEGNDEEYDEDGCGEEDDFDEDEQGDEEDEEVECYEEEEYNEDE